MENNNHSNNSNNKSDKWVYIFVPIANTLIILGKLGIFAYLAYHFNNIWIILLALLFTNGMTITHNKENKKEDKKDE